MKWNSFLASVVLVVHLAFVVWIIFGAMGTRRRPWLRWLHWVALVWSIVVEVGPWPCPLTVAENWLEARAGVPAYSGGFLEHYLDKIVYPNIPSGLLTLGALFVVAANGAIYLQRFCRRRPGQCW